MTIFYAKKNKLIKYLERDDSMDFNEIYENLYESQSDNITEKKKLQLKNKVDESETTIKKCIESLKDIKSNIDNNFNPDLYFKGKIKNGVNAKKYALSIYDILNRSALTEYKNCKKYKSLLDKDTITKENGKSILLFLADVRSLDSRVRYLCRVSTMKNFNFDFKFRADYADFRKRFDMHNPSLDLEKI